MIDDNHTFPIDGEFTGDAPLIPTPTDDELTDDAPLLPSPIYVKFTGDAPPTHSPPDIPDPNTWFFMEAMKVFHKYVLYMFEQFQNDISDLQRRVQMTEALVDAHNHISGDLQDELERVAEQVTEMDDTLLYLQDRAILKRDPSEIDFSKIVYTNTNKPPS